MMPEPQMPVTPVARVAAANPASSDHSSQPITLTRGSSVCGIDAHALDRTRGRALAAADLGPLEGGPRRARAGDEPRAVAEDDLGIGADIDEDRDLVREVRPLGEQHARRVGADVPGDRGQHESARAGVEGEAELGRAQRQSTVARECEGSAAELDRIDAEEEVLHDRVADEARLEDVASLDARLARRLGREIVDGAAHCGRELGLAPRMHHDVGDPAHQVLAEADLRVHHADRRDHLPARELAQVRRDCGRAHVDGDTIGLVAEAGPDRDELALVVDRDGHLPAALAQALLQRLHDVEIAGEPGELPFGLERLQEAPQVARRCGELGLAHLDVMEAHRGIELDRHRLDRLAHELAMDLALRRHVDDEIAQHAGGTGEPPAGGERLAPRIGRLDLGEGREVLVQGRDAVLGELALAEGHLAAPANAAAAAHRIDVDAERARGAQDRRAERKAPAPARWREDDERIRRHGGACPRAGRATPRPRTPPAGPRGSGGSSARNGGRAPSSRPHP